MFYFLAVVMALSVFWTPVSSAGYKDIDPRIAEQEINRHIAKEEARFTFRLQKGGFEKGIMQGMWNEDGKLTARATSSKLKSLNRTGTGDFLISSQNADIRVRITGIKEMNLGMKFKQVQFSWQYDSGVPSLWKRFIVAGGNGYAGFALHDDGWQYDGMELGYAETPFPLTRMEIDEEHKEMQRIEQAKGKEKETEQRLQIERQKRIEESKKARKHYGTFHLSTAVGQENCKIYDVGVTCQKDGNNEKRSYSIMFADIRAVRKSSFPGPASIKYYAIELEKREIQNIAQWISENSNEVDKFFEVLSLAHKEWRIKFSDIAE